MMPKTKTIVSGMTRKSEDAREQEMSVIAMAAGSMAIAGVVIAPLTGVSIGSMPQIGGCLAGLIAIAYGGRALYMAYREAKEESAGYAQSLGKARAANLRQSNWIRRVQESTDFYWETDARNLVSCLEGAGAKGAGYFESMDIGVSLYDWPATNMDKPGWDALRKQMRDQDAFWNVELQLKDIQGRDAWIAISGKPSLGPGRREEGYSGIGRDITAQKVAERLVMEAERIDRLTKLPNRQSLLARLPLAMASGRRRGTPPAIIMLDIAGFERINQAHGLLIGDQILAQIANRLKGLVRETDLVARLDGDKFAVLLEDVGKEESEALNNACAIEAKLKDSLEAGYATSGHTTGEIRLRIRTSKAVANQKQDTSETILGRAQTLLMEQARVEHGGEGQQLEAGVR